MSSKYGDSRTCPPCLSYRPQWCLTDAQQFWRLYNSAIETQQEYLRDSHRCLFHPTTNNKARPLTMHSTAFTSLALAATGLTFAAPQYQSTSQQPCQGFYNTPLCCTTYANGVPALTCNTRTFISRCSEPTLTSRSFVATANGQMPMDTFDLFRVCQIGGQQAKCCALAADGLDVTCQDP